MAAGKPVVERKKITDLTPDPSNANAGTERGLSMLDDSLSVVGLGRSIVTDKHGVIIGGNKTTERALDRGFENAIVVHTNGDELVVVQRDDLDLRDPDPNNTARRMAYYDNRVASVDLQWNAEQLLADVNAGFDFEHLFSEGELAALLADLDTGGSGEDPGAQVDRAAELQQKWQTERGQLWRIGKHRLLCGDSTSAEDVARLMDGERADMVFTDPPYGMDVDVDYDDMFRGDKSHRKTGERFDKITGDSVDYDPRPVMKYFDDVKEQFWWGADYYVDRLPNVTSGVFVVWDKRCSDEMDKVVGNVYEIAWSKQKHRKRVIRLLWSGHHGMQNDDLSHRMHPTQKPAALARWFLDEWGADSHIIVDPYAGSGFTMAACEQVGKRALCIEIEPAYCAVILERMVGMGLTPELQA